MRTWTGQFAIIALSAAACGKVPTPASKPQSVGDIQSMQRRADGNYEVICKGGNHELVTPAQIANDQVCETKPTLPLTISSMQLRTDGRYDLICLDGSLEVRSAEEIRRGEVCRTKPADQSVVVTFDELQVGMLKTDYQGIDWEADWYVYVPMKGLYEPHSGERYVTNLNQKGKISFSFKSPVFFSGAWLSLNPDHDSEVHLEVFDASGNKIGTSETLTKKLGPTFLAVDVAGASKVTVVFNDDFAMDDVTYSPLGATKH